MDELGPDSRLPPCVAEHPAFMAPFELTRAVTHPYSFSPAHQHFRSTPSGWRPTAPHASPTVMLRDSRGRDRCELDIGLQLEAEDQALDRMGFDGSAWIQDADAGRLTHSEPVASQRRRSPVSVAQRVDGVHFELPADAVELLRQVRPGDRQRFIEEVTEALAVAADTKDFAQLQRVLAAWAATIRLQRRPGYEATIRRMQRRERGVPVDLDELRHPRG